MDRMLNAIQAWAIEDSLLEKEVREARDRMRASLTRALGGKTGAGSGASIDPMNLPDLPVGTPPPGMAPRPQPTVRPGMNQQTAATKMEWFEEDSDLPVGAPPPGYSERRQPTVRPGRRQREAAEREAAPPGLGEGAASGVPSDILAAGDPLREKTDRVQPFIRESRPGSSPDDPFPELGLGGRPLG